MSDDLSARIAELEAQLAEEIRISNKRGSYIEFELLPNLSDLTEENKELRDSSFSLAEENSLMEDEINEIDTKLAKAVGALEDISDGEPERPNDAAKELKWCRERARDTLEAIASPSTTEIKGENT